MVSYDGHFLAHAPIRIYDVDLRVATKVLGPNFCFSTTFAKGTHLNDVGGNQPNWFSRRFVIGVCHCAYVSGG